MARIVFDLDGTLIDSAPDIHAAINVILAEEDIAALDLAKVTSFVGNGLPHLVRLVIEATGLDPERHAELTARMLAQYNAHASQLTRPYDGVPEALSALRSQGHRLGICTNKPEAPTLSIIQALDLGPFDVVIGGDSLPTRKPDPEPLHAALRALGTGPAIYVGDSEVDAETARRAEIPFVLFTGGYRKTPVSELPHHKHFSSHHWLALPEFCAELG